MKSFLVALFILGSSHVFANTNANVVISTSDGDLTIAWLGSGIDESEAELIWKMDGAQIAISEGDLCFNGEASEVVSILKSLDNMDVLGDEFMMQNIEVTENNNVSYEVFHGPDEWVLNEVVVKACQ